MNTRLNDISADLHIVKTLISIKMFGFIEIDVFSYYMNPNTIFGLLLGKIVDSFGTFLVKSSHCIDVIMWPSSHRLHPYCKKRQDKAEHKLRSDIRVFLLLTSSLTKKDAPPC